MGLVLSIDFLCVTLLLIVALTKGFERALPMVAFLLMLFPYESQIRMPGFFDLTTQRIIIMELVVLYFALGRTAKNVGTPEKLPLRYLIVLLIAWKLLSSANSVVPDVSIKATLSQVFDFAVPYYIFAKAISKSETVEKILLAFFSAVFVLSIFGAFEAYTGWSIMAQFPVAPHRFAGMADALSDRGIRVQATFATPIMFGTALALAIPIGLYLLSVAKTAGRKLFLWAAILLMFLDIYKTSSRGPWLAIILSVAVMFVFGRGPVRRSLAVIVLLSVTVLVVDPGVRDTIGNIYGATLDPDTPQGESYQWRYMLYGVAQRELSKDLGRSLWGYGPESFYFLGLTAQFRVEGGEHTVKVESCDSEVVQLLMDTGCIGFLIMVALLAKSASCSFRNSRKMTSPASTLFLVLFVNILVFSFMMTNVVIFWGQQSYMFWILIALTMTYPALVLAGPQGKAHASLAPQPASALAF